MLISMFKSFALFIRDLWRNRKLILDLTYRDFRSNYLGSCLGLLWAFIQPTITILIFWFVFEVGFKTAAVGKFPFLLWLMTGIVPWFFWSEGLGGATNSVIQNSFLVQKIVFRVSMLPIVKIMTALIIHFFFIGMTFVIFAAYGFYPNFYSLQVFYYLFSTIILLLGVSWLTSSLIVFLKDIGQIVTMLLQFGFYLTPIFWQIEFIPSKYQQIIKLNPLYYIIEGYRDCFINHVWFWEHWLYSCYFWAITGIFLMAGALVFTRLRPHFADVL